jgi:REP element-mobilizing transposase RayT
MYARKLILPNQSLAHVFFRCHNRQHLFKQDEVKLFLISLWAKYKTVYHINILEFCILENHCHLIIRTPNAELLGNFMRTVGSQIARFVNHLNKRDSAVLRDRYKSPLIANFAYLKNTMQYVWMNRQKATGRSATTDPYCSLSWRLHPELIHQLATNDREEALFLKLLDDDDAIYPTDPKEKRRFVAELFNDAQSMLGKVTDQVFINGHTIGEKIVVQFRAAFLSAFRREHISRDGASAIRSLQIVK